MRILILSIMLWNAWAFAQESLDGRFIRTQRSLKSPFSIPISINTKGELSFFGANGSLTFAPAVQGVFSRNTIEYSQPIILNRFNFYPIQEDLGRVEIQRRKWELGMGLAVAIQSSFAVGLVPFKGSMQTIVRRKSLEKEGCLESWMPKSLSEIESWNEGDYGSFQTYGGIHAYAKAAAGAIDVLEVAIGIRNQFLVEIRKSENDEVIVSVGEENLKYRKVEIGPSVSTASFNQDLGKKFSIEFKLNLSNSKHHDLFKKCLAGNIKLLQERLPHSMQKVSWKGWDRQFYVGIPAVIGTTKSHGHHEVNEDGTEAELDVSGSQSKGILAPVKSNQTFAYQTDESLIVVWASEMNKASAKAVEKFFLSKGRIIGIKGFDRELPDQEKFGSVVTQIGFHVSRKEVEAIKKVDFNLVFGSLKDRCTKEKLSCRKESKSVKIIQNLIGMLKKPWNEMRGELGSLLIKEPALIHALFKAMGQKKEVYFKFLSGRFQSLEGSSTIEI